LAHIALKPGCGYAFETIARAMFQSSHGKEPALIRYEYWRGQSEDRYYCLLSFSDYLGFLAHQASPHHEEAAAPLMDVIADLRLEWLDPVPGASPLPATLPQDLPADASERARRYADMFPVSPASWWTPLRQPLA
jgi:quinol monooxygenase YgiN